MNEKANQQGKRDGENGLDARNMSNQSAQARLDYERAYAEAKKRQS